MQRANAWCRSIHVRIAAFAGLRQHQLQLAALPFLLGKQRLGLFPLGLLVGNAALQGLVVALQGGVRLFQLAELLLVLLG